MALILLAAMLIAAVTDAISREIPVWLFPAALVLSVIWWLLTGVPVTLYNFAGAAAMFLPILILCLTGRMGGGDLIMFTITGFLLGLYRLPAYVFWIGFAAITQVIFLKGLNLFLHKKERILNAEIPFAPIAAEAYILLVIRGYLCIL